MGDVHVVAVEMDLFDGTYSTSCSCGWEGNERNAESDAINEWKNHTTGQSGRSGGAT